VSLNIGQLRRLGDRLFVRTASGIAFTSGGLRLASRAAEMLDLGPDHPRGEAGRGRPAAAAGRVEPVRRARRARSSTCSPAGPTTWTWLSVHGPRQFHRLLRTRAVDVAIGPTA
jgi:hypothetical protein